MYRRLVLILATALASSVFATYANAADAPQTLTHDGIARSYVVRAAIDRKSGAANVPLVFVLHGGGGNAAIAERMTGFTEKARKEGFIVVYPEGTGRLRDKLLTWNAGHCCGYAMKQQVDDVGFISALIDKLSQTYPVDPNRIYATGMSNGGMMAHRLGMELSGKIVAIAPVVAAVFGDEKQPGRPVSALMINGMLDESVPPAGGPPGGRGRNAWDGSDTKPTLDQAAFWARANGCDDAPRKQETAQQVHWRYDCPSNLAVELVLVKDNGHAWPGGQAGSRRGDKPSSSLDATDLIWEFFATHPAVSKSK